VVVGHGINNALEPVALTVFEGDGLDVAVLRVARIECKTVEGSLLADIFVHYKRAALFRGTKTGKTFLVNLQNFVENKNIRHKTTKMIYMRSYKVITILSIRCLPIKWLL